MRSRLLRLPSSSDEDDEDQTTQTLISPNPNPNTTPPPPPPSNPPLEISDDDFLDVPSALSPPSPPPIPGHSSPGVRPDHIGTTYGYSPVRLIDEFLRRLGLRLRPEWLESCLTSLGIAVSGFDSFDVSVKAKMCFEQFLFSDMNYSGAGVLPENLHHMHRAELEGPFVLQVDEIVNICSSIRERYHDAPAGFKRCLKLSLTDGAQRVFGMEYRPIKELEVLAPAGLKIVIRSVQIRRGLLMLVPEVLEVLGGLVEDLDAARQRLVVEVNKPPRGKRKQGVFPLSKRASLAAWPINTTTNGAQANISMSQGVNTPQPVAQVASLATPGTDAGISTMEEFANPHTEGNIIEQFATSHIQESTIDELASLRTQGITVEEPAAAHNRLDPEPTTSFGTNSDMEDIYEEKEMEHPLILSEEKETPFTYLACLLAKWTARKDDTPFIQGKIKCILTGVKGFQFKQRNTFELHVYVEDGSLISEVLIDHHVIQKGIGYSPEEVTAALSSSDKKTVTDMKETMKRFQLFLANFEGTMLVEINGDSTLPVAVEMNQSCATSDAWLLLRRLKMPTTPQNQRLHCLNPINLSP